MSLACFLFTFLALFDLFCFNVYFFLNGFCFSLFSVSDSLCSFLLHRRLAPPGLHFPYWAPAAVRLQSSERPAHRARLPRNLVGSGNRAIAAWERPDGRAGGLHAVLAWPRARQKDGPAFMHRSSGAADHRPQRTRTHTQPHSQGEGARPQLAETNTDMSKCQTCSPQSHAALRGRTYGHLCDHSTHTPTPTHDCTPETRQTQNLLAQTQQPRGSQRSCLSAHRRVTRRARGSGKGQGLVSPAGTALAVYTATQSSVSAWTRLVGASEAGDTGYLTS